MYFSSRSFLRPADGEGGMKMPLHRIPTTEASTDKRSGRAIDQVKCLSAMPSSINPASALKERDQQQSRSLYDGWRSVHHLPMTEGEEHKDRQSKDYYVMCYMHNCLWWKPCFSILLVYLCIYWITIFPPYPIWSTCLPVSCSLQSLLLFFVCYCLLSVVSVISIACLC